jgi:hypothetical protein
MCIWPIAAFIDYGAGTTQRFKNFGRFLGLMELIPTGN